VDELDDLKREMTNLLKCAELRGYLRGVKTVTDEAEMRGFRSGFVEGKNAWDAPNQ